MSIIGISGPLCSGKTKLFSILRDNLPSSVIYVEDAQETVYRELLEQKVFGNYTEITKDRDYLLIYYGKVIALYRENLRKWCSHEGLVVIDGSYLDLLIYGMLNLWYHKLTKGLLENLIESLLQERDKLSAIYMTLPDDSRFPCHLGGDSRRYSTSFKQNRRTEIDYYDIFRDNKHVVSLPDTNVLNCDSFVKEDLLLRGLL